MNVFFLNTWLAVYYENQLTDRLKSRALQCLQDVDDPADDFFIRWVPCKRVRQYGPKLPLVVPLQHHFDTVYIDQESHTILPRLHTSGEKPLRAAHYYGNFDCLFQDCKLHFSLNPPSLAYKQSGRYFRKIPIGWP